MYICAGYLEDFVLYLIEMGITYVLWSVTKAGVIVAPSIEDIALIEIRT